MSLRLGIDIDGVLADFRAAFRKASKSSIGHAIEDQGDPKASASLGQREVKRVWEQIARTPNWWMTLEPYEPDQVARLYQLTRAAGWEVFFLTNRPASAGDTVQFQTQWRIERQGSTW
jgi:phosphoglycolate phosphatase-like HAD superfamily hydrolase